jgi:hypothetical protein
MADHHCVDQAHDHPAEFRNDHRQGEIQDLVKFSPVPHRFWSV